MTICQPCPIASAPVPTSAVTPDRQLNVLLEMRPAFDGYAGIPQETRLLFGGLCGSPSIEVEGLLQTSLRFISGGIDSAHAVGDARAPLDEVTRHSRVAISIGNSAPKDSAGKIGAYLRSRRTAYRLCMQSLLFPGRNHVAVTNFRSRDFADFIWRQLFEKTLPASDFPIVTRRNFRICSVPWNVLQTAGLLTRRWLSKARYPRLALDGVDVFITQTPYPARVPKRTSLVVRYHDAFPILMPHTIANKARHHATHVNALVSNAESGAYFACVSEATRQDLIKLRPELETRAVTIHNMISGDYYEEASSADRVKQIIRLRLNAASALNPAFNGHEAQESFYERALNRQPFKYLLVVSTIEPRKNHARLLSAWELIRAELDPAVKLVFVGNLGWDIEVLTREMRPWIDQAELFVLAGVPAADLRALYRHATATICPSVAEGFDYSGVESLACGGAVVASDIPVHREIYDDAAEYFDPYCSRSLVDALQRVAYSPDAGDRRSTLKKRGLQVSARYRPEKILPKWEEFLNTVVQNRHGT
jgi:glycosyltransferase involved in cell wall biosynthesis